MVRLCTCAVYFFVILCITTMVAVPLASGEYIQVCEPHCCENTEMCEFTCIFIDFPTWWLHWFEPHPPHFDFPPGGEQQLCYSYASYGHVGPSDINSHTSTIVSSQAAIFQLSWPGSNLDLILHSPNGTTINSTSNASAVYYAENTTFKYYIILDPTPGTWTMGVKATDVPPGGEDYFILVEQCFNSDAKFNNNYAECVTDLDDDGKYELLTVNVGIHVSIPRNYTISGYLYGSDQSMITWSIDKKFFDAGEHIMHLDFNGKNIEESNVNGPYQLRFLTLLSGSSDTGITLCDANNDNDGAYTTYAYDASFFN